MGKAHEASTAKVINLKGAIRQPLSRALYGLVEKPLEHALAVDAFNRYCEQVAADDGRDFFSRVLDVLEVRYTLDDGELAKIPADGPVFAVANHPFGGVDGVILGAVLTHARPDTKLMVNYLLGRIEGLQDWIIPVDPFGGRDAARSNLAPMKETLRWLKGGGCVGTFPSGTVSHLHLSKGRVVDPAWSKHVASLVRKSGATVVPLYFEGRNSTFFQLAGLLHPRMRTVLLPKELHKRTRSEVVVRVGDPIRPEAWRAFGSDEELTAYLRFRTYLLGSHERRDARVFSLHMPGWKKEQPAEPAEALQPAQPVEELQRDIDGLGSKHLLLEHGAYRVYIAHAWEIPHVLQEIGRLREQTFREVGEGTGRASDLDRYDKYYQHMFMWDASKLVLVGAYRIGRSDVILKKLGKKGLYTSSLFKYRPQLFEKLDCALELGRSFIVSSYQRKHASLSLLWRGIGEYLVRNPRYRVLFGPVSISGEYQSISKHLMVRFLRKFSFDRDFARYVKAVNPPPSHGVQGVDGDSLRSIVHDIDDVSALVSELETDKKGIPVLLKHYLKLNGVLVSFNVDEDFGRCIDGLIVVDLAKTDPKVLKRYMGEDGYAAYMQAGR